MKRKVLLAVFLLTSILVPSFAIIAQNGLVDAGPDETVYVGEEITFDGSVSINHSLIISIEWDFGDGSPAVNGSDPALLNTTIHIYQTAGVYIATLSVKIGLPYNATETDTVTITVLQNLPPVADAGPDQTLEQTSPAGAEVTLNASGSYDPYGDPLTYNWTWNGGSASGVNPTLTFPQGTTTVTLSVSDGKYTSTDTVNITVQDTTAPIVDAGEDVMVEQESHDGTEVTLVGYATDIADIDLDYLWTENGVVLGNEVNLTYTFNLGSHLVTLSATDDSGNEGSDTVTVTVVDTTPPEIDATVTPDFLWPPNHKYVEVTATVTAYDVCDDSPTITLVSITSNEPDNENGIGDGNTVNDIAIIDDFTFKLRAERAGTGSGRAYTITYQAADESGNTALVSVTITVPHDMQ